MQTSFLLLCLLVAASVNTFANADRKDACSLTEPSASPPKVSYPDYLSSYDKYQAAWRNGQGGPAYYYTQKNDGSDGELAILWLLPGRFRDANNVALTRAQVYPDITVQCGTRVEVIWDSPATAGPHDLWRVDRAVNCLGTTNFGNPPVQCPNQNGWYEDASRKNLIPRRLAATLSDYSTSACVDKLQTNGEFSLICAVQVHCATGGMRLNIKVEGCPEKDNSGNGGGNRKLV